MVQHHGTFTTVLNRTVPKLSYECDKLSVPFTTVLNRTVPKLFGTILVIAFPFTTVLNRTVPKLERESLAEIRLLQLC